MVAIVLVALLGERKRREEQSVTEWGDDSTSRVFVRIDLAPGIQNCVPWQVGIVQQFRDVYDG